MSDVRPIRELLSEAEELRAILDDLNVKYVRIAANGHWSYEKLGRSRHGREPLELGMLLRIADLIEPERPMRSGEWALRRYDGVGGPSILIERLPIAVADRLPQEVLATLKRQVRQPGNGVLVGEPGSGKGGLLLWLALQIPDQPVLYVAENPPSEFPGTHIMHVYPPSSAAERRSLERFVRLSPTVMWDRVLRMSDLQTLYGYPGAGRRWFTTDATSVRSALRILTAASHRGIDARFGTMLHLASSVIGRPEARNLLLRDEDGWHEEWSADESVLGLLAAYETSDIRRLGPTEVSVPGVNLELMMAAANERQQTIEVAEDFAAEAESVAEPIVTEKSKITAEGDAVPLTIEVDDADIEDEYSRNEAITGMLAREEMRELREQGLESEAADGHTQIAPPDAPPAPPMSERTRAYVETPAELLRHDITKPGEYQVPDLEPGDGLDDIPDPPEVNLEDLRITTMEDVDEDDLQKVGEEIVRDFSEVFEADLDFESLAEEMLSEISDLDAGDEHVQTDPNRLIIIDPSEVEIVELDETQLHIEDDTRASSAEFLDQTKAAGAAILRLADGSSAAVDEDEQEDSTKEFTLNDRLMLLRKRRNEES